MKKHILKFTLAGAFVCAHIILATKSNSQMKAACNVDRGAADGGLACMSSSVDTKYQRFPSADEEESSVFFAVSTAHPPAAATVCQPAASAGYIQK